MISPSISEHEEAGPGPASHRLVPRSLIWHSPHAYKVLLWGKSREASTDGRFTSRLLWPLAIGPPAGECAPAESGAQVTLLTMGRSANSPVAWSVQLPTPAWSSRPARPLPRQPGASALPSWIQFSCSDTLPCTAKPRATYSSVIMFPLQYKQTAVARERD